MKQLKKSAKFICLIQGIFNISNHEQNQKNLFKREEAVCYKIKLNPVVVIFLLLLMQLLIQ